MNGDRLKLDEVKGMKLKMLNLCLLVAIGIIALGHIFHNENTYRIDQKVRVHAASFYGIPSYGNIDLSDQENNEILELEREAFWGVPVVSMP